MVKTESALQELTVPNLQLSSRRLVHVTPRTSALARTVLKVLLSINRALLDITATARKTLQPVIIVS